MNDSQYTPPYFTHPPLTHSPANNSPPQYNTPYVPNSPQAMAAQEPKFPSVRELCGVLNQPKDIFLRKALSVCSTEIERGLVKLMVGSIANTERHFEVVLETFTQRHTEAIEMLKSDIRSTIEDLMLRQRRESFTLSMSISKSLY